MVKPAIRKFTLAQEKELLEKQWQECFRDTMNGNVDLVRIHALMLNLNLVDAKLLNINIEKGNMF